MSQREKAIGMLFDRSYRALCLFAQGYVGDGEAAADIVQDAFVALWESPTEVDNGARGRAFLYTAVRNRSLNYLRDRRLRHEELDQIAGDEFFHNSIVEQETVRLLHEAIEGLSPQTKRIITLSLQGMRSAEIAQRLGIAESSVHSAKKIAYRKLREALSEYYYLLFFLANITP